MTRNLISILGTHPAYRNISLALLLSNIGTAFTSIAVYAELTRHDANAFIYSITFIFGVLPGLFTSNLSSWIAPRLNLGWLFAVLQFIGAISLVFPVIGLQHHNLIFLILAEFIGSCLSGFLVPIYQLYIRRTFTDEELPSISIYDSYIFTAQFIFGQLLGTLIYGVLGTVSYLIFDCLTYLITAIWIISTQNKKINGLIPSGHIVDAAKFNWRVLKPRQKRILMLTPLLSLICAPSMSLLPIHGQNFEFQIQWMGLSLTPVLLLLLFRSLGQMLGPTIVQLGDFEKLLERRWFLTGCLSLYLLMYSIIFSTQSLVLSLVCVLIAHISSNIVFILSIYGLQRYFSIEEISKVSSINFQLSVLATSLSVLVAGVLAQVLPKQQIVCLSLIPLIVFAFCLTWQKHKIA